MRTGIYVRVSTEEQAKEGFSIRAQQEKLKDFIRIKDWELYDIYIDEGISGKNITDRPDVNRLITDVIQKKIQNVLVFKIDRLTRSTRDLINLMDLFRENGCAFNSLMESIDTQTASGRMFVKIIGIFAEFERENLIERVSVANEKKAREGYLNSSYIVPYGYSREIGNRDLSTNEEESEIIKEIFLLYLQKHQTLNAIAKVLNMRNIKSSKGGEWGASTIKYILTNPIYIGKVRYAVDDESRYFETEGKHEGIIPEELFLEVQNKISKMKKREIKKRPKEDNYYCGTLMCGECGGKMTTHGIYTKDKDGNPVYYSSYICADKAKGKCNAGAMSHNKVDIAFRAYIEQIRDFTVPEDIEITPAEPSEDTDLLKSEYESALTKLIKKEKAIMTLYIDDKIDFDEYNQMLSLIRSEKNMYADKIIELEGQQAENVQLSKEDIIASFKENWDFLTNLERMQFLQTYIRAAYAVKEPDNNNPNKKLVKIKKVEFYQE